jgi:hypothetical protein
MSFTMRKLHVIQGGKNNLTADPGSAGKFQPEVDTRFGPPPSLLVGIITGLFGAGAGIISLLLLFTIRQPEPYISQQWLIFVFAGAIIGFFIRLEQPFEQTLALRRIRTPSWD